MRLLPEHPTQMHLRLALRWRAPQRRPVSPGNARSARPRSLTSTIYLTWSVLSFPSWLLPQTSASATSATKMVADSFGRHGTESDGQLAENSQGEGLCCLLLPDPFH